MNKEITVHVTTQAELEHFDRNLLIMDVARKTGSVITAIGLALFLGGLKLSDADVGNEMLTEGMIRGGLPLAALGISIAGCADFTLATIKRDVRRLGLKVTPKKTFLRVKNSDYQANLPGL